MENNDINVAEIDTGVFKIEKRPKPKSKMTCGNNINFCLYTDKKFNKLQKIMWKFLLGIKIEDVK